MFISILSKKGGVGKTPISLNIAVETDSIILCNDDDILEAVHKDKASMLELEEIAALNVADLPNTVVDFGGYVAKHIPAIIKMSDLVIVPVVNHISSLKRNVSGLEEITKFNDNVIVVATKTKLPTDLANIKEATKHLNIKAYFELKETELFNNSLDQGLSINDYLATAPVLKSAYGKRKNQKAASILEQWNELITYIKNQNKKAQNGK